MRVPVGGRYWSRAACAAGTLTRLRLRRLAACRGRPGIEQPQTKAPAGATDCHHHIYDERFPILPHAVVRPMPATVADYRLLQKRLRTARNVVVQPSAYGVDNRCLIDALSQFGPSHARGIAVVNERVTDAELKQMHEAGVRGIRFNVVQPAVVTLDMAEALARRIEPLGWHIQVYATSDSDRGSRAYVASFSVSGRIRSLWPYGNARARGSGIYRDCQAIAVGQRLGEAVRRISRKQSRCA